MRAIVCRKDRRVELARLDPPRPGAGEIVLDLVHCGLCGTDLHKIDHDLAVGKVLGHELVGTVSAVGPEVEGFRLGDRVVTPHHVPCGECRLCRAGATTRCLTFREDLLDPGGFSERILVRSRAVRQAARLLPEALTDAAAVFLEPAACVLRGVRRARLAEAPEPAILVLGAGSMGLLHLLTLRSLHPEATLIVSEPVAERRAAATEMGANLTVSPQGLDVAVREATEGVGLDAAFDTVGAPGLLDSTLGLLRSGGTLVLFAHSAEARTEVSHDQLFHEERRIVGTYSGALAEQREVFDMLLDGRLQPEPLISHRMPLTRFEEALALVDRPTTRKILLIPG